MMGGGRADDGEEGGQVMGRRRCVLACTMQHGMRP